MVNFDYNPAMFANDLSPDPCPSFMLFHQEDQPDLQAASQVASHHQQALLKRHLQALNTFSDDDITAALHDLSLADVEVSSSINPPVDMHMDSDSDDDVPLGEIYECQRH